MTCLGGEFEVLRHLLPRDYDGVIVDAGGFIGVSALALRGLFPAARLIVVEPSERNIEVLKRNASGLDRIEIVYGALVGRDVDVLSLKNRGTGECGFTVVDSPGDRSDAEAIQQTPAYTLSRLGVELSEIGLLKLDIEGGEHDILANDAASISQIPIVFAELHDRIVPGCTDLFMVFARNRVVVKDKGEKYLAIRR